MQLNDAEDLTDEQVMDKLDEAYVAHTLEVDPKWKIVSSWLRKERDVAQRKLNVADPEKRSEVVRHQETIRICNYLADKIFTGIKKDGELALLEAQDRGLVPEAKPELEPEKNAGT